jgi:hypothetical protein
MISNSDYKSKQLLRCKIISHSIETEQSFPFSKYVEYCINVYTNFNKWTIFKRYSNFEELHKKLASRFHNLPQLPKKVFFNFRENIIKERKEGLEAYLNFFLKQINVCNLAEILEFIEMDRDIMSLLIKNHSMIDSSPSILSNIYLEQKLSLVNAYTKRADFVSVTDPFELRRDSKTSKSCDDSDKIDTNYYRSFLKFKLKEKTFPKKDKSPATCLIKELLKNLDSNSDNQSNIIKIFEEFLNSKIEWPKFDKNEVILLLYGTKELKGLFYHIGNLKSNLIGSINCLHFIKKLLDYEFNPQCELFVIIIRATMTKEWLRSLNLFEFFKLHNKNITYSVFKILKVFHENDTLNQFCFLEDEMMDKFSLWLDSE